MKRGRFPWSSRMGERVQPQYAHAAGERIGEPRHQQDVGGTRQDEPSGGLGVG